jgi:hypothetical protein
MYLGIPVVFRRLYTHAGDISKTSRERHVTSRLYAFFVINNLVVFSVFGSAWRFVASVIAAQDQGVWEAIKNGHLFSNVMTGLCNVSTFWLTWQMQRNLGAATDLVQLWPLVWGSIQRKWFSPTPRQVIELSAPQSFQYADYYNNYLFVATVGLCFGTLQPLILPITAFYVGIDVWFKKYLLQYVVITKTESGGRFWRLLVNRLLFAVLLANAVIALVVGAQGIGSINSIENGTMLYAMIPLPFLLAAFKWYLKRNFDDKLTYYSTIPFSDLEGHGDDISKPRKNDRVGVRFGHPALWKRLITPMVHAKSVHLLREIYGNKSRGDRDIFEAPHRRSTDRAMPSTPFGYSDVFMSEMSPEEPGKEEMQNMPQVELVAEQDLDFENFKKRQDFREEFGGDGELYGKPEDMMSRPGTPSTFATMTDVGLYAAGAREGEDGCGTARTSRTEFGVEHVEAGREGIEDERSRETGTEYGRGYQLTPRTETFDPVDISIPTSPFVDEGILGVGGESFRQSLLDNRTLEERNMGYFESPEKEEDTSYEPFRRKPVGGRRD